MKINFYENRPLVEFLILGSDGNFYPQVFLVDTGFTGNIIFAIKSEHIFKKFDFYNITRLDSKYWIEVADGRNIITFSANIIINTGDEIDEKTNVLIMDSDKDSYPIIGIDFLRQNKKSLNLDFGNEVFELV